MKIIGIDFGSKRVGVAVADSDAGMAFPKTVLHRNADFLNSFKKLCVDEGAELIILGESKNFKMEDNTIMKEIMDFKNWVETDLKLKVEMHPEFMTSAQAVHDQGQNDMLDASAATIILQSYLDKQK